MKFNSLSRAPKKQKITILNIADNKIFFHWKNDFFL